MSDNSKIEWNDATWNPVRGCTKIRFRPGVSTAMRKPSRNASGESQRIPTSRALILDSFRKIDDGDPTRRSLGVHHGISDLVLDEPRLVCLVVSANHCVSQGTDGEYNEQR